MTADDLDAPLGQRQKRRRRRLQIPLAHIIAGVLALFLVSFLLWAVVADNPFGGEPMAAAPVILHPVAEAKPPVAPSSQEAAAGDPTAKHLSTPAQTPTSPGQAAAPNTKTVTIINGSTGEHQDVAIPAPGNTAPPADTPTVDPKFLEMTGHGLIPKIAADGARPADAFAHPVQPLPGKPDAPRVALIITGLGISTTGTAEAMAKLPGPVTLAFTPYGGEIASLAARARSQGHEVLLEVPMEPFDYPDNDSGPQTLLTSLTSEQNLDRLYWLMSRFQGYVGITSTMGARFTASETAFAPILREISKRGLIFVDDGSNARSIAGRIAGANNLPFVKADVVLDAVPTAGEIDHALDRLEMAARERSVAVGIASALPVSIERIANWAKAAASRGLLLVPVTAAVVKAKAS